MIRYLHLSDLHLTSKESKGPVEAFNQNVVTHSMVEMIRESEFEVDFVVITGDIARMGSSEEYAVCEVFCSQLLEALKLGKDRMFLVPGNHDVDRSKITKKHIKSFYSFENQDDITETFTDEDILPILMRKFEAFNAFSETVMGQRRFDDAAYWYSERLNRQKTNGECGINLVGLNSCLFAGYDGDEERKLALGLYQVEAALKNLEKGDLSICFFHHPFHCFHPEDKVCKNLLMNRFDLILTGHLHDPSNAFTRDAAGQALIIGAGAGFETRDSRNSFNVVEIDSETGEGNVQFYKYLPDHNRWKKDTDVNPSTDDGSFAFQIGRGEPKGPSLGKRHGGGSTSQINIEGSQVGLIGDNLRVNGGIHFHSAPKPEDNAPLLEARLRYLKDLAAETNRLPWGRLSPDEAGPGKKQNLRLADIYIGLDTTEMERMDTEDDIRLHFKQKEEMKRISTQEMIDDNDRLVLLGDPGSGKTTLVNFLTHTMACACSDEDPDACMVHLEKIGRWSHGLLFPVRVVLRSFAEWCAGGGDKENALLGYIQHTFQKYDDLLWRDVHKALQGESTPVFVLLDGLDEVAAEDRRTIVKAIDRFVDQYPHNRYLATCRIYAYVDESYRLNRFRQTVLAPFNEDQVNGFIKAWYAELVRQTHLDQETGEQQSSKLISAVQQRGLMELAERPLLMTVMALLHTSYGQLPEDRIELYQWTVDLLFRRWKGHIGGENSLLDALDMPQLRMTDLEAGLYHAAFDAHAGHGDAEGTADIPEMTLLKGLKPYLGSFDKAEMFVHYVRERAGLLIRHKTDAYTFPHRTFQEFMAACHLVRMKDYPKEAASLVKNDPDRWRIVFILAAGLARKHQPGNAIYSVGRLCPASVSEAGSTDAALFNLADIAAEALLEIGLMEIERDDEGIVLLERIRKWLLAAIETDSALEPKERVYSGNLLSQLGDPRFNPDLFYLPKDDHLGFVEIPAGDFLMGDGEDQHTLPLPEFWINRYPVTVAQFRSFVESSGQRPGDEDSLRGINNHPVVWVSWHEAMAYCKWLTDALKNCGDAPEPIISLLKDGWRISLPSEAEWEKAARGAGGRIYPWGNDPPDPNKANYNETGIGGTGSVGCFPGGQNPLGLLDMAGNVWEWTNSLYDTGKECEDESSGAFRVIRGGSWILEAEHCRTAYRYRNDLGSRLDFFGFRLALRPGQQASQQGA